MGTWDATILGNDTSAEVYEAFFERYDRGAAVEEIHREIDARFEVSLALDEDRHNVLFARALASWEIGALDRAMLSAVREAVSDGSALAACRSLGASAAFSEKRARALAKLVDKLAVPRASPRKRRKPPAAFPSPYAMGACLAYRRPTGALGGVVVIRSELFARRGTISVAATDLALPAMPTHEDFSKSRLVGFGWEDVSGQAARYASPNGKTGRIVTRALGYQSVAERAVFFERCARLFTVVGQVAPFSQVLLATRFGSIDDDAELLGALERLHAGEPATSADELERLAELLSTRPLRG